MNASRTKTNEEEIRIPYRNGILHGRDLNFNNKEVASKCWWALASLIDWADEKKMDKKPEAPISFTDILKRYQKTCEYSQRINAWKKRPIYDTKYWQNKCIETIEKDSPEYLLLNFLEAWKNKQWGKLAPKLLHTISKHLGKEILDIKTDYSKFELIDFYIKRSEDINPSTTKIKIQIAYLTNGINFSKEVDVSLNYANQGSGFPELRGEECGSWYLMQLSLRTILFD